MITNKAYTNLSDNAGTAQLLHSEGKLTCNPSGPGSPM